MTAHSMDKPIRLRGHHLRCVLLYVGKGYSPDFVENFDRIVEHVNLGTPVEITSGYDDVCLGCDRSDTSVCKNAPVCREAPRDIEDSAALLETSRILDLSSLRAGDRLSFDDKSIRQLREHFEEGIQRCGCAQCLWHETCAEIAANNFEGVKLFPQATPAIKPKPLSRWP